MYSSPFRRMQGKTQVHPLPVLDYLRTRLTHTIEVAQAGRVIATICAREINQTKKHDLRSSDIGDIVYAACLAHDIGNPPFGHIGEYAIQTWFEKNRSEGPLKTILNNMDNFEDFEKFDGNAQGFRILTRLHGWRGSGGLQLSYATLGTFSKYPFSAKKKIDKKKFGFMHDDADAAERIYSELGLIRRGDGYCRHPLAFIVEAADDICYLTTDIEDAFRTRLLPELTAEPLLKNIASMGSHMPRYNELQESDPQDKIAYLRAGAISSLIDAAMTAFVQNYDGIMEGKFDGELLAVSKYKTQVEAIRRQCQTVVYKDLAKMQLEVAGNNIISTLMDIFGGMIGDYITKGPDKMDMRNDGIYQIFPKELQNSLNKLDSYKSFLCLVDYVSGMTDRFALELFQKLTGSSVSLGRMR